MGRKRGIPERKFQLKLNFKSNTYRVAVHGNVAKTDVEQSAHGQRTLEPLRKSHIGDEAIQVADERQTHSQNDLKIGIKNLKNLTKLKEIL